jgi:transposase
MALEATIKICDPVRVPANDPLFRERDPAVRATLTPLVSLPSGPACSVHGFSDPASPGPAVELTLFEARRQAAYYKSMHQRSAAHVKVLQLQLSQAEARCRAKAALRLDELEQELATAKARIRQLEQQAFGRKTESSSADPNKMSPPDKPPLPADSPAPLKRVRGQQPDKPRPKRRDHSALPGAEEVLDLPADQRCCSACGLDFKPFPGTEDNEILEIEVKAHRRLIRRRRYRPACSCGVHKGILCPPPAPRVLPKSNLGVSIWVEVLLDKFRSYNPTHRLLADWRSLGLNLPSGTVTSGLKRLGPLFKPVYDSLIEHNRKQEHWHGDETRWLVFAKKEGKVGHRWIMWLLRSQEVAVYLLDPTRAHEVPEKALGPAACGIMNVDRYSAYKALKQVKEGKIVLAFCWAHVRRDFLEVARSWSEHEEWGFGWVRRIGLLYKYNKERVQELGKPEAFKVKDEQVREQIREMVAQRDKELAEPQTHEARRKVLESLKEHWSGLTVFVDHPKVPMDNNQAERDLRGPVVGRKNYYGSGALWAGELAAMLFSVVETLEMWNINPRIWLTAYLQEVACAGGKALEDHKPFLPWNMSQERKKEWALEVRKKTADSS